VDARFDIIGIGYAIHPNLILTVKDVDPKKVE
jgi:hypothetical protein